MTKNIYSTTARNYPLSPREVHKQVSWGGCYQSTLIMTINLHLEEALIHGVKLKKSDLLTCLGSSDTGIPTREMALAQTINFYKKKGWSVKYSSEEDSYLFDYRRRTIENGWIAVQTGRVKKYVGKKKK